jgi:hypothetical protein
MKKKFKADNPTLKRIEKIASELPKTWVADDDGNVRQRRKSYYKIWSDMTVEERRLIGAENDKYYFKLDSKNNVLKDDQGNPILEKNKFNQPIERRHTFFIMEPISVNHKINLIKCYEADGEQGIENYINYVNGVKKQHDENEAKASAGKMLGEALAPELKVVKQQQEGYQDA